MRRAKSTPATAVPWPLAAPASAAALPSWPSPPPLATRCTQGLYTWHGRPRLTPKQSQPLGGRQVWDDHQKLARLLFCTAHSARSHLLSESSACSRRNSAGRPLYQIPHRRQFPSCLSSSPLTSVFSQQDPHVLAHEPHPLCSCSMRKKVSLAFRALATHSARRWGVGRAMTLSPGRPQWALQKGRENGK